MTLLNELKAISKEFAEVNIIPVSDYYKQDNKTRSYVKHLFTITVVHKDNNVGKGFQEHDMFTLVDIAPSKYMNYFYQKINDILDTMFNGKIYLTGCSECGNKLEYFVNYNPNRVLRAVTQ